jgi:FkbM family methyltransferase
MKVLVVSCLFTEAPVRAKVYKAPRDSDWECIFFSNSRVIGEIATRAGWTYCPLSATAAADDLRNSLASKQVKFLRFLESFDPSLEEAFKAYTHIIYHDHKVLMTTEHVRCLLVLMQAHPNKHIFNFETPRHKDSVFTEVAVAQQQSRYLENMGPTLDFIGDSLLSGAALAKDRITRTTVLAYRVTLEVQQLTRTIYDACHTFQQPECQIFWSVLTQRNRDLVHTEPWENPAWTAPTWKAPEQARQEWSFGADGLEEIELHSGERIITYADDLITEQIRRWGGHTRPEYAFATARLRAASRVFDLGAHIGTFTLAAARAVTPRGLLLAVEGNPAIYRILRDNLSACSSSISINCYVGSGEESVRTDASSSALLHGNSMGTKAVLTEAAAADLYPSVKTRSVDELVDFFFAPDLIKLDLEGLESRTIMSSAFIRDRTPDLYLEVCDEHQRHYGSSVDALIDYLAALGYRFFTNIGERNASHDSYVCSEVASPKDYKAFWDVYCSTSGTQLTPNA